MSTIYFKHHSAGLINQAMSVETAFALAFLEKSKLYIYNAAQTKESPIFICNDLINKASLERKKLYAGSLNPTIFDLLNIPSNIEYVLDYQKSINEEIVKNAMSYVNLLSYYYCCEESNSDEINFSEGRSRLIIDAEKDVHLYQYTFPLYSRFFYNRPVSLDKVLSQLTFKEPYQSLAKRIAERIGPFRGLHFRLTDHANNYDFSKITSDCISRSFNRHDIPFIISSDDKDIVKNLLDDKYIFIDEIIQEQFADDFLNLPFHNEVVFGLISLLVMAYSEEFIGTPGSTFSGYIHRLRVLRGVIDEMNYLPSGKEKKIDAIGKPYSWNSCDLHTNTKSWYREWPECKLQV